MDARVRRRRTGREAKHLARLQTRLGLVEISELTGFDSTSHFSRSYKEFYGHTPSSERRPGIHAVLPAVPSGS